MLTMMLRMPMGMMRTRTMTTAMKILETRRSMGPFGPKFNAFYLMCTSGQIELLHCTFSHYLQPIAPCHGTKHVPAENRCPIPAPIGRFPF